jgi:hypothetical protein
MGIIKDNEQDRKTLKDLIDKDFNQKRAMGLEPTTFTLGR